MSQYSILMHVKMCLPKNKNTTTWIHISKKVEYEIYFNQFLFPDVDTQRAHERVLERDPQFWSLTLPFSLPLAILEYGKFGEHVAWFMVCGIVQHSNSLHKFAYFVIGMRALCVFVQHHLHKKEVQINVEFQMNTTKASHTIPYHAMPCQTKP